MSVLLELLVSLECDREKLCPNSTDGGVLMGRLFTKT